MLILTSCQSFRYGNFNKQKYTHLKKIPVSNSSKNESANATFILIEDYESSQETEWIDSINHSTCDSIILKNGQVMLCDVVSENKNFVEINHCPSNGQTYQVDKVKIHRIVYHQEPKVEPIKIVFDKTNPNEEKEFEITETSNSNQNYSVDVDTNKTELTNNNAPYEKKETLEDKKRQKANANLWNRNFNVMLTFVLLGIAFIALAILTSFFGLFILSSLLLLVSWIMSVGLINRSKTKNKKFENEMVPNYTSKLNFTKFVNVMGYLIFSLIAAIVILIIAFLFL